MSAKAIALCLVCQAFIIVGQLFLKRATTPSPGRSLHLTPLAIGILCLTFWFFLWLGLMSAWDLSKLFPFEGLNPALVALAASIFLKETLPARAWVGIILICAGIAVVAGT